MWHKPLHYFSVSLFFQTRKETLPSMLCTVRKLQYMTGWMLKSIIPKILTIGLKLLKQTNKQKKEPVYLRRSIYEECTTILCNIME